MHHYLSPVAVFAALVLAFVIDYFSFGPDAWRDKFAFLFYLAGVREGFGGGTIDNWLLTQLGHAVDLVKAGGNTYLAGAQTNLVVGIVIAGIELFVVGCLLPEQLTKWKWMGKFPSWRFPRSGGRIGWKLLALAIVIGLLADNVGGAIGRAASAGIVAVCALMAPLLNWMFVGGAS